MEWYEETFRVTVVLLVASGLLIGPGLAGAGSSPAVVAAALAVAGLLYGARSRLETDQELMGHALDHYGRVLWVSGVVAAAVCAGRLSASSGELLALGGLVGLAGMLNYFLRPVYRLLGVGVETFFGPAD